MGEQLPFDIERITQAIRSDSYVRQALSKYRDLFWKEGWTITGENQEAVKTIWDKLSYMEYTMGQPFQNFLVGVVDELLAYHNAYVEIVKNEDGIIEGYNIIPTETVRIIRDKFNKPVSFGQVNNC